MSTDSKSESIQLNTKQKYDSKFTKVTVRFTDSECTSLAKKAIDLDITKGNGEANLTKYVYLMALKNPKKFESNLKVHKENKTLLLKMGNNLNQIARRLNALTGSIKQKELADELSLMNDQLFQLITK